MSHNNLKLEGEQYTYDYFFLEDVCRLCWSIEGAIELASSSSTNNADTIADTILQWLGVDVSTPSHPKKVCMACLNKILTFAEFKRFCLKSDKSLRRILQNDSLPPIIHPFKVEIEENDLINKESDLLMEIESIEVKIEQNLEQQIVLKQEILDRSNSLSDESRDILPASAVLPEKKEKAIKQSGGKIKRGSSKIKFQKRSSIHCYACHLNLDSMEKLTEHKLDYHGIEENGMYKCYGCDKRFAGFRLRLMHESRYCKELRPGYKCTICDKYLPKRKVFEPHMRAHRENKEIFWPDDIFKCDLCSLSCNSSESLREHMFVHYKKKKKYVCETCGRVFNSKGNLDSHKLTHETQKPLKCPHCNHRSKQPSSLAVHIRIHTGERPYACDLCPHRSINSSNLIKHRKVHFGGKDFECNICQKQFRQKDGLAEHIASVHERIKLHSCNQCDVQYSRFRNLREHLLSKHGQKVKKVKDSFIVVGSHTK